MYLAKGDACYIFLSGILILMNDLKIFCNPFNDILDKAVRAPRKPLYNSNLRDTYHGRI